MNAASPAPRRVRVRAPELVGKGGTVEYTPEAAGEIEYICSVHPTMTGKLTVEE